MVSVIIPNYNHAQYLRQRIDSVLNQTYQDFEIIILDDFSTDDSKTIIELYRMHPRVSHIIYNPQNSGSTFVQWKRGLELAKGEWIWIAESDDYCEPAFLEIMLQQQHDLYGIKFSSSIPVNSNGNQIEDIIYPQTKQLKSKGNLFLEEYFLKANYFLNASAVVIRTDVLENVLTNDISKFKLFGDWLVWCKASLLTDIHFFANVKNFHRHHHSTVRTMSIKNGIYNTEFRKFRVALQKLIKESTLENRRMMLEKNNVIYAHELGMAGCELIKKRSVLESIPYIMLATIKLNFSLYYLRSAIYWLLQKN